MDPPSLPAHSGLPLLSPAHIGLRHLATEPIQQGVRVTWLVFKNPEYHQVKTLEFARVVLGCCLAYEDEPPICIAVGMRALPRPGGPSARYFVALDEAQCPTVNELVEQLIILKDRYRCPLLYTTNTPPLLLETLRRTEGLSFYRERRDHVARERWRSFVSFDTRCGIYAHPMPDDATLHRELDYWLETPALDPGDEAGAIKDASGTSLSQLLLPYDTNTQLTQAALRLGNHAPCLALWLAVRGLDRSSPYPVETSSDDFRHQPNPIAGY